jgi:hypothetical protein
MHVARAVFSSGHRAWDGGEALGGLGAEGPTGVGLRDPPEPPHPAKQPAWLLFPTQPHQVRISSSQLPPPHAPAQSRTLEQIWAVSSAHDIPWVAFEVKPVLHWPQAISANWSRPAPVRQVCTAASSPGHGTPRAGAAVGDCASHVPPRRAATRRRANRSMQQLIRFVP